MSQPGRHPTASDLEKAIVKCRMIIQKNPRDAASLHALSLLECRLGRLTNGMDIINQALALEPENPEYLAHRGCIFLDRGEHNNALADFQKAIGIDSINAQYHFHLGNAYRELGALREAIAAYRQATVLQPTHVEALNNLGNLLKKQGFFGDAILSFQRAITVSPEQAMLYNNLGLAYVALGLLDDAEIQFHKAIERQPRYPEALNNLGNVVQMRGGFEESKAWYARALKLRPDFQDALGNLANTHKFCGEIQPATDLYHRLLQQQDSPEHHHNLALALLVSGQLVDGWREYEWRWQTSQLANARRPFSQPQWRGEAAEGQTILIHAEQGFGDTLQFCRYIPLVAERGLRVILEVQPPLVRLMQSLAGGAQIMARGDALPSFDLHCPMLSLPLAFGTTLETIPATIPYLFPKVDSVRAWRDKLPEVGGKVRVGFVWAGSARFQSPDMIATDRRRSIDPKLLAPLMDVDGVQYFTLQKGGSAAPASLNLIDKMADCKDFADTAALIANLDLVISVDTAVVHLAAAMGKPVWLLNRYDTCWRWLLGRDDSPWYPSARQFRQKKSGDWGGVIRDVIGALKNVNF
jgi:tetratricopeptide (TPR) repeat protein